MIVPIATMLERIESTVLGSSVALDTNGQNNIMAQVILLYTNELSFIAIITPKPGLVFVKSIRSYQQYSQDALHST